MPLETDYLEIDVTPVISAHIYHTEKMAPAIQNAENQLPPRRRLNYRHSSF